MNKAGVLVDPNSMKEIQTSGAVLFMITLVESMVRYKADGESQFEISWRQQPGRF